VKLITKVETGFANCDHDDTYEITREELSHCKTAEDVEKYIDEAVATEIANYISGHGWFVHNGKELDADAVLEWAKGEA